LIEFFDKLYMNHCDCLVAHKNNALVEIIPWESYELSLDENHKLLCYFWIYKKKPSRIQDNVHHIIEK
jgi:hypothetical protein